ncbi:CxC2 domain-containing protein [Mycena chlorophos]|uniref:CxC2 domain-containing protein n=1 Tax=Mycena chlorophos TaxID=658473 RepID=A0A8H6SJC3_MYCCL|nr:CxC2 domain-containing protein [Mycena chlorophos]
MRAALSSLRNHLHLKRRTHAPARLWLRNESQILFFADLYQIGWFAVLQIEAGDESKVGFTRLKREDIRYMDDPETFSKKVEKVRQREERQKARLAQVQVEEGWISSDCEMEVDGVEDPEEDDEFFTKGSNQTVMSQVLDCTISGPCSFATAVRIEWSKAWARLRRWEEEVGILTEETRRVPVSHESWATIWEERAHASPVGRNPCIRG